MGGRGTLRLVLHYPDTWVVAYALSPALVGPPQLFTRTWLALGVACYEAC
jgi:hypothetical protein